MPKCIHCDHNAIPYKKENADKNGKCKICDGTGFWEKDTPV